MQTVSGIFDSLAKGHVRPLAYAFRASFDKQFDPGITFFILDVSILDGPDILGPSDDNPIQEWDKYLYQNFDNRVISLEVTREESEPYSVTKAFSDITLNNYDSYFTPNSGSPIDQFIIPKRPMRLAMGFGSETVNQFVGLSEGMPELDKSSRLVSFHAIDFLNYLMDKDIGESILLQNVRTDEVLEYLLEYMGLLPGQYSLDDSLNTIAFFFVDKGAKFGTVVSQLMEAEIGRFYMDEQGIVRFRNRYNFDLTPVYSFTKANTIDYKISDNTPIINSVLINSDVRAVQEVQSIWTNPVKYPIPNGQTIDVWLEFSDPVTTMVDPSYSAIETNTSYFTSNLNEDGTGVYTGVSLVSADLFSKTAKLVFQNTGGSNAYITAIDIYGTPAKVIDKIKVEEKDQPSIDKFDEQLYTIDNPYIQDRDNAISRALLLINDYKNYGSSIEIDVKGSPALQMGDAVDLDLDGYQGTYVITKITNIYGNSRFTQRMRVLNKTVITFFTLDVSVLDGPDVLSP